MKKLNIQLTEEQLNLVLQGLGNLPYVTVANLINEIQVQCVPQLRMEKPSEEDESDTDDDGDADNEENQEGEEEGDASESARVAKAGLKTVRVA